ncbi:MAG: MurT ligase domain-containing protein [Eggerthellaceae bacterium]|nr:MurT ligase domain-containing protein [Eggerthellaceae bacterium]
MDARLACAKAVASMASWGLRHLFGRAGGTLPGKIALHIDPHVIADLAGKAREGAVMVVGTNGKTTVTNLIADAFEAAGKSVICNRDGDNMSSGVASTFLHAKPSDVAVIESDELWLARTAPQIKPRLVVLLNLFRDQLDRMGEIDRIQDSIVSALAATPGTTLAFNADDPLCAAIAARVSNNTIAFGVEGSMGLAQNTVVDAQMCQQCLSMMEYRYRQYGQLGEYRCPSCGFARPARDWSATDVALSAGGLRFNLQRNDGGGREAFAVTASFSGAYMVYNLLATAVATREMGVAPQAIQQAIDAFNPQNGRLQRFELGSRRVLLNLAKNPTGFNQNLKIILQDEGPKTVAFFINDKTADGHDVSWLWDIDFEELAGRKDQLVFAGGTRAHDMLVRLKYSGVPAGIVSDVADVLAKSADASCGGHVYIIGNYTALPSLRADLERMAKEGSAPGTAPEHGSAQSEGDAACAAMPAAAAHATEAPGEPLVIMHLFPDLLNLYGDGGNVTVLAQRMRARGLAVEVRRVKHGQACDLSQADIVFLGGGPDREQRLASEALLSMGEQLHAFAEDDGVLLAICGGFQILGREWLLGEDTVEGLGILGMTTVRAEGGSGNRLIDNVILQSPLVRQPVVGYENHAGRTHLDAGMQPFGTLISSTGHGNDDDSHADGALYRNVLGTYLHGPLLAKNPQVADWLLARGLEHLARRTSSAAPQLAPLDDAAETAANEALCKRFVAK